MRTRRGKSEGVYIAVNAQNAVITAAKGLRLFLKAGYTVSPLRSYLTRVYRESDNPTLKALIAYHYPECTGYVQEQMEYDE